MNSMKRQRYMTLKDELLMLVGARYIVLEKSREIAPEEAEPKWKQHPGVDVTVKEARSDDVKNNIA